MSTRSAGSARTIGSTWVTTRTTRPALTRSARITTGSLRGASGCPRVALCPRPARARIARRTTRPALTGRRAKVRRQAGRRNGPRPSDLGPQRSRRLLRCGRRQPQHRALRGSQGDVYNLADAEPGNRLAGQEGRRLPGVLPDPPAGLEDQVRVPPGDGRIINDHIVLRATADLYGGPWRKRIKSAIVGNL